MYECANNKYATARCRPEAEADNRVVAEGEDGYFSGTTGLPVGLHIRRLRHLKIELQQRAHSPHVLPDGSASRAAGSFIYLTFRRIWPYDIFMSVEREKGD